MTPALLLLAAVLVNPHAARTRLHVPRPRVRLRVAAGATCVVTVMVAVQLPVTAVISTALAVGTAYFRRGRRGARIRAQREGRALSGALELLVAELRAGAHPVRAFDAAASETAGPVGAGLRSVAARARLGADVAGGLVAAAGRSGLPRQWERLAACWQLAAEHGLPIGVLMRAAALDIAERHRYAARVDAGMAGARATSVLLAALPVLGVFLGELLGAAPTSFLSRGAGGWVLVIGVGLLCGGVLWAGRITDRLPA